MTKKTGLSEAFLSNVSQLSCPSSRRRLNERRQQPSRSKVEPDFPSPPMKDLEKLAPGLLDELLRVPGRDVVVP